MRSNYKFSQLKPKIVKEAVRVISSDPPCIYGNVQLTKVPWKALPDQV